MFNPTSNRQEQASLPNFSAAINFRPTTNTDLHQDVNSGYSEWSESLVKPSLIQANVVPFGPGQAWDWLIYSEKIPRRNTGVLTQGVLKQYENFEKSGGWLVQNINPVTGENSLYNRAKFDHPRVGHDGKVIKYESPPKTPTEPIFLKVPHDICHDVWFLVASLHNVVDEPHLYRDFWDWVKKTKLPLWITEGEKKAGCLLSGGRVTVSVPGINNVHDVKLKKEQNILSLHPYLEHFADGRDIIITFDRDEKPQTITAVRKATKRLGKLFKEKGCNVKICIWDGKKGKGIDDFIANGNTLSDCEYLTFERYCAGAERIKKYKGLSYPIGLKMNSRYIGDISFPSARILALKAPKGTGKTTLMAQLSKQFKEEGKAIITLSHRRNLAQHQSNLFGLRYRDEMVSNSDHRKEGFLFGFGACIDSLSLKGKFDFDVDKWIEGGQPYVVFLDEIEQLIWHLLDANTEVKNNRLEIEENLRKLLFHADIVAVSDADLSDLSLDYLCQIMGIEDKKDVFVLENTYKGENNYTAYMYQDNTPDALIADLMDTLGELANNNKENRKPHFVFTHAREHKSLYSAVNIEKMINRFYPKLKVLVLDAESVADPNHPAFGGVSSLNNLIHKYDVIIASPVIETGVSIDKDHQFSCVWAIGQGVTSTDSVRQSLSRVRDNCDRRVWLPKKGLNKIGNGATNVKSLLETEGQKFQAHKAMLSRFDWYEEADAYTGIALETWGKMACRINYGYMFYREVTAEELEAEGNTIIWNEKTDYKALRNLRKRMSKNRDDSYNEELLHTEQTPSLTSEELKVLETKLSKTETERRQLKRGKLEKKYKVPFSASLAKEDDKKLHPKLRFYYYLTIGRKHLSERDKKVASSQVYKGKAWLPDFNKSQYGFYVHIFDKFGATKIFSMEEQEFSMDSEILKAIVEEALKYERDLKKLNITVSRELSVMQNINNLFKPTGTYFPFLRKIRDGERRIRIYGSPRFRFDHQICEEVLKAWLAADDSRS